jgi:ParB family chromosome partitioning protein
MTQIRIRNKELRHITGRELREHPDNFKIHPKAQKQALETVLSEIGFAGAVLAYEADDGSLVLIDGHLRRDIADDETIPVMVTDLTEDEADALLPVYDPVARMAEVNREKQKALLERLAKQKEAFAELAKAVAGVTNTLEPDDDVWRDMLGGLPDGDRAPFQQKTFTLHDEQVEIVDEAIQLAHGMGDYGDTANENRNGNALARICELFIGAHQNER